MARTVPSPDAVVTLAQTLNSLGRVRDLDRITEIVRGAARQLTHADGATFILRDGDNCHYADEDAISPLWKGRRFPMEKCVSGWVMANHTPLVLEDIYSDPRVLWEAYHPTFVKSLAIAPIRRDSPIGAVGIYWAMRHAATPEEMKTLVALADGTALALAKAGR